MNKIIIICILGLLATSLHAQKNLTLDDAIKKGLENNYQVMIVKKNYDIAENNDAWGAAGRYPVINAGVTNANRFSQGPNEFTGDDQKLTTLQVTPYVNLNWIIFNGFSIGLTKDNLEKLKDLSKGSEIDVIENTVRDIKLAYYQALLEKEKLEVFSEVMALSKDKYDIMLMRKELGSAVTFELLQEKNAYLRDSASYIGQQILYKNSLRNLVLLLGEDTSTEYVPSETFEVDKQDYTPDELTNEMLSNNRALRILEVNQNILNNNVGIAKSVWYPQLSLNSGIDYSRGSVKLDDRDASSASQYAMYANITLSINLFNGGNNDRAIENAIVEEKIGELRIGELKLTLTSSMQNLLEIYDLRKQMYNLALENKNSAKLNLDIALDKYESGAINSFNYRDIQLFYLNAAIEELQSVYNLIETQTHIQKLAGNLL